MRNAMPSSPVTSRPIASTVRVGFIGLGQMGLPMARNLARAGYGVVAHDVDRDALRRARDAIGAEVPGSLKAAAERCDAVITMLPDGETVRAVALGAWGAEDWRLSGVSRASVLMDMSSSFPIGNRDLGGRLAWRGVGVLRA